MADKVHTVVQGDTLWGISQHYHVEIRQLIALNGLQGEKRHHLRIGQQIKLPDDESEPDTELSLRILDLAFQPIKRAKLKLEYDGASHEVVGNDQGEIDVISIDDHAKGIKIYFRELDGKYSLIADHHTLPVGRKRLTLTSRKMLVHGNYPAQQGEQRKTTAEVRRELKGSTAQPHIKPAEAAASGGQSPAKPTSAKPAAASLQPSKPQSQPQAKAEEPGLLDRAQQAGSEALTSAGKLASDAWTWLTGNQDDAVAVKKPAAASGGHSAPVPVVKQTRVEGGQPTQVIGPLFAEENLKLKPANEKYRKVILSVAKRHGMAPQALAAVINAEAAKASKTGEWLADSKASTSSASGLTQFLNDTWLELATDKRSLVNQKLKKDNGFEQVNLAYVTGSNGKRRLDFLYGTIGDKKQKIDRDGVLNLRFEPEYSIDAGAVYALGNLAAMERRGVHSSGLPSEDLAKLMYLAHHEGSDGAIKVIKGTLTAERAEELLPKQVPDAKKRTALLKRFDNDYAKTYIHWLFTYTDTMIDVRDFMVKPGTFTPKTSSEIAVATQGVAAARPAAKPAAAAKTKPAAGKPASAVAKPPPTAAVAKPTTTAAGANVSTALNAAGWRNPLDSNGIRSAGLASWRGATFGMVRSGGKRAHQGVDLIAVPGTAIYAVGSGKVVSVYKGFADKQGFGATLILCVDVNDLPEAQKKSYLAKRPDDKVVYFAYCHLSKIDITVAKGGTPVAMGMKLGETGQSGNAKGMNTVAKGAHLHFEVRYQHPLPAGKTGLKYRVDPRPFLLNVPDPA